MTWTRIVAIPLIVGVFYLPESVASVSSKNLIATVMFILFAATDWLDGFLARKLNQTSSFGAFLDPVADKFLVCASLLVLVHLNRADVFVGLIIIGREIAISALREWMAQIGASKSVAVHMIGKLKTVAQMVAIPFLLYDGRLFDLLDTHHQELEWRRIGHPIAGNDEACAPDQYKDRRHQPDQAIRPGLACHLTRARISGNAFCR